VVYHALVVNESGEPSADRPVIRPYAWKRMAERDISEEAVRWVLARYHTRRPAPARRNASPTEIFIGDYQGRSLKVYVARGSSPPFVKTVVWEGDE
jgi:hypothetical protein